METNQQPQTLTFSVQNMKNECRKIQCTKIANCWDPSCVETQNFSAVFPQSPITNQIDRQSQQLNCCCQSLSSVNELLSAQIQAYQSLPSGNYGKFLQIIVGKFNQNEFQSNDSKKLEQKSENNSIAPQNQQSAIIEVLQCSSQQLQNFVEKSDTVIIKSCQQRINIRGQNLLEQINVDNVIQILKQSNFTQRKQLRSVFSRKQQVALNLKLRETLLNKYMLLNIPKPAKTQVKNSSTGPSKYKQKKQNNKKVSRYGIKQLLIRKLHKVLIKKKINNRRDNKFMTTLKLITKMEEVHGLESLAFREHYVKLIRQINGNVSIQHTEQQNQRNIQLDFDQKSFGFQHQISSKAQQSVDKTQF